ncbi:MAG: ATP cone domain-containing protein [Chloroflexota bacterium]
MYQLRPTIHILRTADSGYADARQKDGTREEFSRDKLLSGIRVACAKRPISAADIERIAGEIEAELQRLGQEEVRSRVVGDLTIRKLKELDLVAYIRYAIVYLRLDDLSEIRGEIDRLLTDQSDLSI